MTDAVRAARVTVSCDLGRSLGHEVFLSQGGPDTTEIVSLAAWPPTSQRLSGVLTSSVARTRDGRIFATARTAPGARTLLYGVEPNPLRIHALPVRTEAPGVVAVWAVDDRVMVLLPSGGGLAWWRDDGTLDPVSLPQPPAAQKAVFRGRTYACAPPSDTVDVLALGDGDAWVVRHHSLARVGAAGVTTVVEGIVASADALREGRTAATDASGRAVTVLHEQLIAVDREGALTHPTHGLGHVRFVSEMLRAGERTVTAHVVFESGERVFDCLGDHWVERAVRAL